MSARDDDHALVVDILKFIREADAALYRRLLDSLYAEALKRPFVTSSACNLHAAVLTVEGVLKALEGVRAKTGLCGPIEPVRAGKTAFGSFVDECRPSGSFHRDRFPMFGEFKFCGLRFILDNTIPPNEIHMRYIGKDGQPHVDKIVTHARRDRRLNESMFGNRPPDNELHLKDRGTGETVAKIVNLGTDEETWTCNEHATPPTYPLSTLACEVCGRQQPKG